MQYYVRLKTFFYCDIIIISDNSIQVVRGLAYSELIKNFQRIRGYMREFYIYGFKTRDKYIKRSRRTYDNERRRIESYLGDYMGFRQGADGKNVFLSIDSRSISENPFYKTLKSKSFTDIDITLHFILFDILHSPQICLSLCDITEKIDTEYLSRFDHCMVIDESTVRKKLKEYTELGFIIAQKHDKKMIYHRAQSCDLSQYQDAIRFFAESGSCGVIGSFLLDRIGNNEQLFSFKHHYISSALDSEILCSIFPAIRQKLSVSMEYESFQTGVNKHLNIVPLQIFISVQNGRQYLIAYDNDSSFLRSYRIDYINKITPAGKCTDFDKIRDRFEQARSHVWGVSFGKDMSISHVEFTIHMEDDENYIYNRLVREKRCGRVERIDANTCRFTADVYDTNEMIPWIRTFICRIASLDFSDKEAENRFRQDVEDMYRLYDIGGDE